MMKKYADVIALSIVFATGVAGVAQAASVAEIRQRGYLVAAVADQSSGFATIDRGQRSGFDPALLTKLQQTLSLDIRVKTAPLAALAGMLESGDADLVATSLEITPEQQKIVEFTPPLAEATLYYLKRHDDDRIKSFNDLATRPLGMRRDSNSFLGLTELEHGLAKAENKTIGAISEYDTDALAYDALAKQKVDFVIGNIADLAEAAKAQPDAFTVGQPVAHKVYVAWASAGGNTDLAAYLKDFVLKERANGNLAALQQQFLGWTFADLPETVVAQDWWTSRTDKPAEFPIPTLRDPD